MLNQQLVRAINRGRCFLFVGSGPSCEIGYPSWERLARDLFESVKKSGSGIDEASYLKYLDLKKYPELFKLAESDIGGRNELVHLLTDLMNSKTDENGYIYERLTEWPFACYLTTNYDDEIEKHLNKIDVHFSVRRNHQNDLCVIREGISHVIFKLHSDLKHPEEAIITSDDYDRLYINDEGRYFRDRIRQVFEFFDILIIGHSLSDPDINFILRMAKKNSDPKHPVFMIAADYEKAEEVELLDKYNIILLPYKNENGDHAQLRRILSTYDRFIAKRKQLFGREVTEIPENANLALSIFLFRKLQGVSSSKALSPLILFALNSVDGTWHSIDEILVLSPLSTVTSPSQQKEIEGELENLYKQTLVEAKNKKYRLTPQGKEKVSVCLSTRRLESEQAYGQFVIDLKRQFKKLTQRQEEFCKTLAEKTIVNTFKERGLVIAKKIFNSQSSSPNDLTDIFGQITNAASELDDTDLRLAFVDSMHQFIVSPSSAQIDYLASVSQGYFLYHMLGLDPACSIFRKDVLERTFWLLDSNILLPLLAIGCNNHEYAKDLLRLLTESNTNLYTTENLLLEADYHLRWANQFAKYQDSSSTNFLQAVLSKGSYKQNLFLDGYIKLCADGVIGTYEDYLDKLSINHSRSHSFKQQLEQFGINILRPSEIDGFEQRDWGEIEQVKEDLCDARTARGTYRSELQVESEAEIKIIIDNLRSGKFNLPENPSVEKVYFISQSRILDSVFGNKNVVTWTPEAVYRYLSSLQYHNASPGLLQQCMLNEYYNAGISVVDKKAYLRFFGTTIEAAKLSYEQEKKKYLDCMENVSQQELDDAFDNTPDLEKPFFVSQMAWKVAENQEESKIIALNRALEAEHKVRILEAEKEKAWKDRDKRIERQEAGRLRNLQDPKHIRKRLRQAKKRQRRKKKR